VADKQHSMSPHPANLSSSRLSLARLWRSLARPIDALPLDLFRVLVGMLVFAYFLRTFFEARDLSGPDGLIDHELSRQIFWFTRLGLFQPGLSLAVFQTIFLIACLCSWALILGYRVKIFAAILYLIAVSTYRWNFLVMYVDDSIMHLMLLWMLLLPVGRTLVLSEWIANRNDAWRRWKSLTVPGAAVRCFCWNLALIYLVAGAWKWTSPMWRDGTALYTVLKLPISQAPNFWGPQHLPLLKVLDYAVLVFEPLFPLIFLLPRGHRAKYGLLFGLLAFHLGSAATLQIPFANLACVAAAIVMFGGELMSRIRKGGIEWPTASAPARLGLSGMFALLVVTTLTLAMISSAVLPQWRGPTRRHDTSGPQYTSASGMADHFTSTRPTGDLENGGQEGLRPLQTSFFAALWCVGIAQQYQLFNWIDERNYTVSYRGIEYEGDKPAHEIERDTVPVDSTRNALLQFYLHGITWMRVPPQRQLELRRSLQIRLARRYCQRYQPRGVVAVYSTLERIYPAGNRVEESGVLLMRFGCYDGEPRMEVMNLDP
jgi:hypothetical protein